MSQVAVIGGGFGGIASALRLRAKGNNVILFERLNALGGRAQVFKKITIFMMRVQPLLQHLIYFMNYLNYLAKSLMIIWISDRLTLGTVLTSMTKHNLTMVLIERKCLLKLRKFHQRMLMVI